MKRQHALTALLLAAFVLLSACGQGPGTEQEPQTEKESQTEQEPMTWQEQYDFGLQCLSKGNYEDAIEVFTAAIALDPEKAAAYVGRGDAYIQSGETEEHLAAAQADYKRALELDAANVGAYLGLTDIDIRRGSYDEALHRLELGLEQSGGAQAIADKIADIESGRIEDSAGNIRKETVRDENGELLYWHDYTYDAQGNMASVTSFDENGVQNGHIDLEYDQDGNCVVGFITLRLEGTISKVLYEYDSRGNRIKATNYKYGSDSEIETYSLHEYDEDNKQTRMDYYAQSESGQWERYLWYTYEYDDHGNAVRINEYFDDNELPRYSLFEYDEQGNMTKHLYYERDNTLLFVTEYHYDSEGNQIGSDEYDGDGNLIESSLHAY